jgi:hypothetical protein
MCHNTEPYTAHPCKTKNFKRIYNDNKKGKSCIDKSLKAMISLYLFQKQHN